jgi:hypothetical protein
VEFVEGAFKRPGREGGLYGCPKKAPPESGTPNVDGPGWEFPLQWGLFWIRRAVRIQILVIPIKVQIDSLFYHKERKEHKDQLLSFRLFYLCDLCDLCG